MRRAAAVLFLLALVAGGCGGGDESSATTTTGAPSEDATTTVADVGGGGDTSTTVSDGVDSEFCAFVIEVDRAQEGIEVSLDPETFRESIETSVDALQQARDLAPEEIRDDVDLVATTFAEFAELLEEYRYDFVALGAGAADDPRFLAFEEAELDAATERIGEFCGIDLGTGVDRGDAEPPDADGGEPGDGDALADALTPPGVTESAAMGSGTTLFSSEASFQEAVDFYLDALGPALFVNEDEESAVWSTVYEGAAVSVNVSGQGGGLEILVAILG
jgi:hypothetical protein